MTCLLVESLVGCATVGAQERGRIDSPPPPTSATFALGYDDAVALRAAFVRTTEYHQELWGAPSSDWPDQFARRWGKEGWVGAPPGHRFGARELESIEAVWPARLEREGARGAVAPRPYRKARTRGTHAH